MMRPLKFTLTLVALCGLLPTTAGQDAPALPEKPAPPAVASENVTPKTLRDDQLAVSGRYSRFERTLTQMADILGRQDPERADLLRRAIGKGREGRIKEEIESVVALIESGEIGNASEKQAGVIESLQALLKLLQSEDRRSAVERERDRLDGLLKDVRSVLAEQRAARAATQNSPAPSSAAPGQQKAISETDKLLESMREHDDQESTDGKDSQGKDSQGKDGDNKDKSAKEGEPKDGQPKEGQSKDGDQDPKDPELGKGDPQPPDKPAQESPAEGKPSPSDQKSESAGKPGEQKSGGKQSGQQKSDKNKQTPGREQLEKAREEMEQALEKLKEQKREDAVQKEDNAIEELHAAAEKLEEMLRQLREEEKEMMLASLEARFQRMLQAETEIHEGTVGVAATPQKDWLDLNYGRCRELSQQQSELTQECAQTVNLLREEGTSVAIVIAVEDIEADMNSVSGWMQEYKVGELTQAVQKDILESLKQLIETTQKEMQQMKEQQKQEQKQSDPSQEKPGLVALMAEIRVLRSLQLQVNRRTKQVDGLLQSAMTDDLPALQKQLHDLANRQNRLIESAKELAKQAE
ncbi:MAG: hypothetical protein DWI22_20495 [Planctomycetota bacterium]|nr:MAG: hypothetical protein DWI22_20495 [Planctomycetota bacterium]